MRLLSATLFSLSLLSIPCVADGPPPPPEYVNYSSEGRFIVRLAWDAKALKAKIQLFELADDERSYVRISEFPQIPMDLPRTALVTDDGALVITFDTASSMGRGPNVVAVFSRSGEKLRSWSLDEILTRKDRESVADSVSNTFWRKELRMHNRRRLVIVDGPSLVREGGTRYSYALDLVTLTWRKIE